MSDDVIILLVGSISIILPIFAIIRLITSKLKDGKKLQTNEKNEKQIENAPPSVLGFLEMNSSLSVEQKVGSMIFEDILESYLNKEISIWEAQKKLVKEGFSYDETFDILQDYIKNLDEKNEIIENEIIETKKKFNLISKISAKNKRVIIDDIIKETGMNKNDIIIILEELHNIGIVKKIKLVEDKKIIIFS